MYAFAMSSSEKRGAQARLQVAKRAPSESLQKVQRGEMSLDDYLDEATEVALARLKGKLVGEALANVRETLREHIRTNPVVVEMIRQLTGQTPKAELPEPKN